MGALRSVAGVTANQRPQGESVTLLFTQHTPTLYSAHADSWLSTCWLLTQHMPTAMGSAPSHRETQGRSQPVSESSPHPDTHPSELHSEGLTTKGKEGFLPGPLESTKEGPARPHPWPRRLPELPPAQGGCPSHSSSLLPTKGQGFESSPCSDGDRCGHMGLLTGRIPVQEEALQKVRGRKNMGGNSQNSNSDCTLFLSAWWNAALPIQP